MNQETEKKEAKILKEKVIKDMVEEFQCMGCSHGGNTECGKYNFVNNTCQGHRAGTFMGDIRIALGLPKAFQRVTEETGIYLYEKEEEQQEDYDFDIFNIPVWAYEEDGYLFIKVYSPRILQTNVVIIKNGNIKNIKVNNSARSIEVSIEDFNFQPLILNKETMKKMG